MIACDFFFDKTLQSVGSMDQYEQAQLYMKLRAPLVPKGAFGVELRGPVPDSQREFVVDLLRKAREYEAVQVADPIGILIDFTQEGDATMEKDVLHLRVRERSLNVLHGTVNEPYALCAVIFLLIALVIFITRRH